MGLEGSVGFLGPVVNGRLVILGLSWMGLFMRNKIYRLKSLKAAFLHLVIHVLNLSSMFLI